MYAHEIAKTLAFILQDLQLTITCKIYKYHKNVGQLRRKLTVESRIFFGEETHVSDGGTLRASAVKKMNSI